MTAVIWDKIGIVSDGDFDMRGDFDTVWEAPNISESAFHAETALVAFDS